jgi:hypothetical protein
MAYGMFKTKVSLNRSFAVIENWRTIIRRLPETSQQLEVDWHHMLSKDPVRLSVILDPT